MVGRVGCKSSQGCCHYSGLEQYLTGVVGWLVELVTLTFMPERSDVNT